MTTPPLTADTVLGDLASAVGLEAGDVDPDDTLFDLGIDSVRLMGLLERWRAAGASVDFAGLSDNPTVRTTQVMVVDHG